jgi:hypothetical protein
MKQQEVKPITSKRMAIVESLKLWKFLSLESGRTKTDYNNDINAVWESGCPLCSWFIAKQRKKKNYKKCNRCPLDSPYLCNFSNINSVYDKWTLEHNKKYAKVLYDELLKYYNKCYTK